MSKIRSYFLFIWKLLDPLYYRFSRLSYIEKGSHNKGVFRVRLIRYKGQPIHLKDGTLIRKNDILLKIHLHNVRLLKEMYTLESDLRKGLYLYNNIKNALPKLAEFVSSHKKSEKIKAIIGVTMLHQGSERLGFEIHPILNQHYLRFKQIAQFPIYLLSRTPMTHRRKGKPQPKYLFMTKEVLISQSLLPAPAQHTHSTSSESS
ncbi:YkoP family protein [Pullulanibacillus camelliae]|uniref:YkoP family protein n=1 Tax=Pullulanibacillus camelliae TaxID=1707096 RepID=UPI001E488B5B|nr:hypothetical protein [Pullulanibacillus camelliae]